MRTSVKWQERVVTAAHSSLVAKLERLSETAGAEGVWNYLQSSLGAEPEPSRSGEDHDLSRFLSAVEALRWHLRHDVASRQQQRDLLALANGLLKANGIKPGTSKLSFLYAEVKALEAQLAWRGGSQWLALWQQAEALALTRTTAPEHAARHHLFLAERLLRKGDGLLALRHLETCDRRVLAAGDADSVLVLQLRGLFLTGQTEAAQRLLSDLRSQPLSPRLDAFLVWFDASLTLARQQDPGAMFKVIRRGARLAMDAERQLEAGLWFKAIDTTSWTLRLTLVRSMARRPDFAVDQSPELMRAALTLEQAYDEDMPLSTRLSRLSRILSRASRLASVEQELLVWLCAARFLARQRLYPAAGIAYREYRALSQRLAAHADVLGIGHDLERTLASHDMGDR